MPEVNAFARRESGTWLVKKLSSKKPSDRAEAEKVLSDMGQEGVDLVLDLVRREARKRHRRRTTWRRICIGYVVLAVTLLIIWLSRGLISQEWDGFPKWFLRALTFGSVFGSFAYVSGFQKQGTKWLARYQDRRAAGPLLDALDSDDEELKTVAGSALITTLPLLQMADRDLLTAEQRRILYEQLEDAEPDLATRLLDALRRLEVLDAIPDVEVLMQRLESENSQAALLQTARTTLAELRAAKTRERERETLLRPSDEQDALLLRPAASGNDTDPAVLLRPLNSS